MSRSQPKSAEISRNSTLAPCPEACSFAGIVGVFRRPTCRLVSDRSGVRVPSPASCDVSGHVSPVSRDMGLVLGARPSAGWRSHVGLFGRGAAADEGACSGDEPVSSERRPTPAFVLGAGIAAGRRRGGLCPTRKTSVPAAPLLLSGLQDSVAAMAGWWRSRRDRLVSRPCLSRYRLTISAAAVSGSMFAASAMPARYSSVLVSGGVRFRS